MINRGPSGALCGYVGVPPTHPYHGMGYDDIDIDVHGGLTYHGPCRGEICHVPEEGREHDIWWFGFDCAHFNDVTPKMDADLRELKGRLPSSTPRAFLEDDPAGLFARTYKDWAYVTGECRDLAWQLIQVKQ
jgi:hypothetical protein